MFHEGDASEGFYIVIKGLFELVCGCELDQPIIPSIYSKKHLREKMHLFDVFTHHTRKRPKRKELQLQNVFEGEFFGEEGCVAEEDVTNMTNLIN